MYSGYLSPGRLKFTAITGEDPIGGLDEQDFAHLVHRYLRKAMVVAMEYCDSLDDAEDVVQETFRRVAEGLSGFDRARPFDPWFFTILTNTARNAAKSRRVRAHTTDRYPPRHRCGGHRAGRR